MIVELNGATLEQARSCARRLLERTAPVKSIDAPAPRKYTLTPEAEKLERARMRAKVAGTRKLRNEILRVLDEWRDAVVAAVRSAKPTREADLGQLETELDDAVDAGVLTDDQKLAILAAVEAALASMDPQKLADVIAQIQSELYQAGLDSASGEIGTSWDTPPTAALEQLASTTIPFSKNIVDRERAAITQALSDGIAAGEGIPQLADRIAATFDDGMHILNDDGTISRVIPSDAWAELVARTETSRAMNAAIVQTYHAAGVERVMWVAAEDERTSFAADTFVETTLGPKPICKISAGDEVFTPVGKRYVKDALKYVYGGDWLILRAGARSLMVTADHPVWSAGKWKAACELRLGDVLETIDDEIIEIDRLVYLAFGEANHAPPELSERRVFAAVASFDVGDGVPVIPIDLDGNAPSWKREIYGPTPNSEFLNKVERVAFEYLPHDSFETVLSFDALTAGYRARSAPDVSRAESRAAVLTVDVEGRCEAARLGAGGKLMGLRRWNGENLLTNPAPKFDPGTAHLRHAEWLALQRLSVTGVRAVAVATSEMPAHELASALLAVVDARHIPSLSDIGAACPNVFNIEVDGVHVFYADGILVHNCPDCDAADGSVVMLEQAFPDVDVTEPPAHPACRCTIVSVAAEAAAA